MSVDKQTRDESKKNLSKYISSEYTNKVEESINKFSENYANVNDTPYLIEQIYQTKFEEILKLIIDKENPFILNSIKENKIDLSQIAFDA